VVPVEKGCLYLTMDKTDTNKMNKEFVTYEIALALKELGFDEPCFAHFVKHYNEIKCILDSDDFDEWWTNNSDNLECTAPLKQQALRWIREKYGKESYVRKLHTYYYHINDTEAFVGERHGDFSTYEEAELACLIKLIEIVKSK
jgi:hypothetical protein